MKKNRKYGNRIVRRLKRNYAEIITILLFVPIFIISIYLVGEHIRDYGKQELFKLLLDCLGLLTGTTVFIVIYTAIRAEKINRSLLETQTVAAKAVTGFKQLFDQHLIKHFHDNSRGKDNELEKIDLILSTPAFGLHPLGPDRCNELIEILRETQCEVDIVLFTPDAHFPHFLNTLLWENGEGSNRANCWQLAYFTKTFMEIMQNKTTNYGWHIWPSNSSDKRMFHFQTIKHSHLYLVLSDDVTLSNDLKEFKGRSLPLPSILREAIVGGKQSIFEKYKVCPSSGKTGDDAALSNLENDEFGSLLADYLLGRTSQIVQSLQTFRNEILHTMKNQKVKSEVTVQWLNRVIRNYLIYLHEIGIKNRTKNRASGWVSIPIGLTEGEQLRIKSLTTNLTLIKDGKNITYEDFTKIFENINSQKRFMELEQEKILITKENSLREATIEQLILILYLIARSGMGESQFIKERRIGAES
jgi:hypothetical protein